MTSEALGVVRAFFDAADAEDDSRMSDCLDPEVVWFGTRGGLDQDQVLRGPEAVLGYLREIQEPWERYNVEVEQEMEAGDAVVVFMRETAKLRQGDMELHDDTAMILTVRNGKIVEMKGYLDREEALKAARHKQ